MTTAIDTSSQAKTASMLESYRNRQTDKVIDLVGDGADAFAFFEYTDEANEEAQVPFLLHLLIENECNLASRIIVQLVTKLVLRH